VFTANPNSEKTRYIGKLKKYTDNYFSVVENKNVTAEAIIAYDNIMIINELFGSAAGKREIFIRGLNCEKTEQSLSRTRSTVFELVLCNEWNYFATFTLNGRHERDNINVFRKKFTIWLKNYNVRNSTSIKYLLIPEQHRENADGKKCWHCHGVVMGLPAEHLTAFRLTDKLPLRMKKIIKNGRELYNWQSYADKFGFVSLERIQSIEATAKYITKYITKNVKKTEIEVNKRMFYASQGLKRAEILHEGEVLQDYEPDFENDYIRTKTFQTLDEALTLFAVETKGGTASDTEAHDVDD